MLFQSVRPRSRYLHLILATAAALTVAMPAAAWERSHADGPNSGFADVETMPATNPGGVGGIGTFAPGAGPVTAADGTLYLGNQQGQLMAFQPDGTRLWSGNIAPGHAILAAPAVDSEGSIYVIGTRTVRNDLVSPPLVRHDSTLYKFSSAGALAWQAAFPNHALGPTTSAPPNIWKSGNVEVIMAPAYYPDRYGYAAHLVAFSKAGARLEDIKFFTMVQEVTGGYEGSDWCLVPPISAMCWLMPGFNPSGGDYIADPATQLPSGIAVPHPGVAILNYASAGTPFVLVADQMHELVAYTFTGNRFNEIFRIHDKNRWMSSPPMVLPDAHTAINTSDRDKQRGTVFYAGPNMTPKSPTEIPYSVATPTRMADGRIVIVGVDRKMAVFGGTGIGALVNRQVALPGQSMVSAAASRTHLFVSTAGSFLTYDASTLEKVAEISWVGGGTVQPIIGPFGHVYAMASNTLLVFPPPTGRSAAPDLADPGAPVLAPEPGAPALSPKPASPKATAQKFDPPLTVGGNRLFACEKLDGDDCGKSDARNIAQAFCETQGFAKAGNYAVEQRKGKAETLDGQFCSKNKCKVFDRIACE